MATASQYGLSYLSLGLGRFNFAQDNLKMMLTTSSYVPSFDTHEFKSQVVNEVTGPGYTAGGQAIYGQTWTYNPEDNWCILRCSAITWDNLQATFRYGVIYKDTGDPTTSPLLSWVDFNINLSPDGLFRANFPDGICRIRSSA